MTHDVRGVVERNLAGVTVTRVEALGHGLDNTAYLVDGELVVRFPNDPGALDVVREARLLRLVAGIVPVAVPEPLFADPVGKAIGYRAIPGVPLLDLPPGNNDGVVATLSATLRALHATPMARFAGLVTVDDEPLTTWLAEARELAAEIGTAGDGLTEAAAWFLRADPPPRSARRVVSHNDLGIEHVLVDPRTRSVTGVIDWSDTAICDPAYDYGLLLRDLGPIAIPDELRERAWFYARCSLIEDLAYGLKADKSAYVEKSRARAAWLFERE